MFANMFDSEKMQEVQQKQLKAITQKYNPLIEEYQKAKKESENRNR